MAQHITSTLETDDAPGKRAPLRMDNETGVDSLNYGETKLLGNDKHSCGNGHTHAAWTRAAQTQTPVNRMVARQWVCTGTTRDENGGVHSARLQWCSFFGCVVSCRHTRYTLRHITIDILPQSRR